MNIVYLSHGGGPLPLLGDSRHREMVRVLEIISSDMLDGWPEAVIVVSAHWEETIPTLTAAAMPGLLYDYYGFSAESYEIRYPAPGAPELARRVSRMLGAAGISSRFDKQRGFDHGLFVPMKIMYPQANIPCIQLSLCSSLDPAEHLRIGEALAGLASDRVLVIGSGFSFHNLPAFFTPAQEPGHSANIAFEKWLIETMSSTALSEPQRKQRLLEWQAAPGAEYCHPRAEHLLPLMVCYGMAGKASPHVMNCTVMDKQASFYIW